MITMLEMPALAENVRWRESLRVMRFFIVASLVFIGIGGLKGAVARAEIDVEFILDVSGSMTQKLGGESQIDLARKALLGSLAELRENQSVALRVYGHRVDQTKKDESCRDTELLMPFQKINREEFSRKIGGLVPRGYTPIAYSLEQSRNDLLDVGLGREAERVIILLTDGEETCGGNPVAVLEKLKAEGFRLTVYTVGFNVNEVARKQLTEIAAVTGGKYFDAPDGVRLGAALREATKASAAIVEKTRAVYGTAIRGGDSYEQAVRIDIGKDYRLDHVQKQGDFDYFVFDGHRGDFVTLTEQTLTRGISIRSDGRTEETSNPYAGAQLHSAARTRVRAIDIIGSPSKAEHETYRADADGPLYVLIGSTYAAMNPEHVTFRVSVEKKGDLGGAEDAGDTLDSALPVKAGRYAKNSIGDTDRLDVFSIDGKKGDRVVIGVVPNGQTDGYFTIRLFDEFKQNLYQNSSTSNAGVRSEEKSLPEDGPYYIEVGYPSGSAIVDYTFVVRITPAESPGEGTASPPSAESAPPAPPASQ